MEVSYRWGSPDAGGGSDEGLALMHWHLIDDVPLDACFLSPLPEQFEEAWAVAGADVLYSFREAPCELSRDRALKWFLLLHDLLLRLPPRGGRRGRAAVAHRFTAWTEGDLHALLRNLQRTAAS